MELKISTRSIVIADKKTEVIEKANNEPPLFQGCQRSVAVITCASHAQGPRFEPGR